MLELGTNLVQVDLAEATDSSWRQGVMAQFPFFGTTEPITLFETQKPLYAESGRPLVENRENPADVPSLWVARRHDSGREGQLADYAAYTELLLSYQDSLGLISYLRDGVSQYRFKTTPDGILSALYAINNLPYWLFHRSDNPVDAIPVYVVSAAKEVRGMVAPIEEYQRNLHYNTAPTYKIPTEDDLTGSTAFVDYLFRNNLLASRMVPNVSCPATRDKVQRVANVIFDGPHEAQGRVEEKVASLGITSKTINRIKKFGRAMANGMNASMDFADQVYSDPDRVNLLIAEKPVWVTYEGFDKPVDLVAVYLKKLNASQDAINQSLKRRKMPALTRRDIAKKHIVVR